jgi:hypothetical protein
MLCARHLLGAEDLRKRAEDQQKSRRRERERQSKSPQQKPPKRPRRNRCSVRTDSGPIALRAFWSMHVEAMNFSGIGHAEYAAALGLSPLALRIWRDRLEESGEEMELAIAVLSECAGSIRAFSSEVDTGSREENASKQKSGAPF